MWGNVCGPHYNGDFWIDCPALALGARPWDLINNSPENVDVTSSYDWSENFRAIFSSRRGKVYTFGVYPVSSATRQSH